MIKEHSLVKFLKGGLYIAPLFVLVYFKLTIFPFVTLKTFGFHILIEFLFIAWLFLILWYPKYRPRINALVLAPAILLLVLFATSIFGINFSKSLWSIQARGIGLISLAHFYALFLILISLKNKFNWSKYLNYIFWVSVVAAAVSLIEVFSPGVFFTEGAGRLGGTFGNPTFFASYLLFTIFLGYYLTKKAFKENLSSRHWLLAGLVFEGLILFLTNTRGALIGLAFGVFLLLLFQTFKRNQLKKISQRVSFWLLILLIALGSTFGLTRKAEVWQSVPGFDRVARISLEDSNVFNRLTSWQIAWDAFQDRPVIGYGFENFTYAFDSNYRPELLRSAFSETFFDKPHNIILEFLTAGGIIGLLAYLGFLLSIFVFLTKRRAKEFWAIGVAMFSAYIVQNLFIFDTFGSYLMLFTMMAYVYSLSRPEDKPAVDSQKLVKTILVYVFGLIAVYLLFINVQILRANKLHYNGLNHYANVLFDQGDKFYDRAFAINDPYNGEIRKSLVSVFTQSLRVEPRANSEVLIESVFEKYQPALEADPQNYSYWIQNAESKISFARINPRFLKGIEEDLSKAEALSPNRQQTRYSLAQSFLNNGDTDSALIAIQEAVNLDPLVGEPHLYYGLIAFDLGQIDVGFREVERAFELNREPNKVDEFIILGNFYGDNGRLEESRDFFLGALEMDPEHLDAKLKLGLVSYDLRLLDDAKDLFIEVLEGAPAFRQTPTYQALLPIFQAVGVQ